MVNKIATTIIPAALVSIAVIIGAFIVTDRMVTGTTWEYLTIEYHDTPSSSSFPAQQYTPPYESITVDREPYSSDFTASSVGDCDVSDYECRAGLVKGIDYYLSILGADGWELIAVVTGGDAFSAGNSQQLIFKRPR